MTVHQFLDLIAKASIMTIITVEVGGPLKDIAQQAQEVSECVEIVYRERLPKEPSARSKESNEALRGRAQTPEEFNEEFDKAFKAFKARKQVRAYAVAKCNGSN